MELSSVFSIEGTSLRGRIDPKSGVCYDFLDIATGNRTILKDSDTMIARSYFSVP